MIFDVLIVGGGVSGLQCAMLLGSALDKPFANDKKVGIILHQRASHLQDALFNNVLGLPPKKLGKDILIEGTNQLSKLYSKVDIIKNEKVISIEKAEHDFLINSNKQNYFSKMVVIALNYSKPFTIQGLEKYIIPHQKSELDKDRIQLKNQDHLVDTNLFCCGTIAGHRSQFAIAAGSGAAVATDILTIWNHGLHTKVHDKA